MNLYLGDCLELIKTLPSDSVDAVITDIPYFQVVSTDWDNQWSSVESYLNWLERVIVECERVMRQGSSLLMFTGRQYNPHINLLLQKYFTEKRVIIWARKRAFNNTRGKSLSSGYEPICYYTKGDAVFNTIKIHPNTKRKEYTTGILKDGVNLSDVWLDIPSLPHNAKERVNHPTQKPIRLMERCVQMVTNRGGVVLDPFMGSGSTGVACKNTGRDFIGIEKEENYYNVAKERLQ